jgi:hypothetical protein
LLVKNHHLILEFDKWMKPLGMVQYGVVLVTSTLFGVLCLLW